MRTGQWLLFAGAVVAALGTALGIGSVQSSILDPPATQSLAVGESVVIDDVAYSLVDFGPDDDTLTALGDPVPAGSTWVRAVIVQELQAEQPDPNVLCDLTFRNNEHRWISEASVAYEQGGSGYCGFLDDAEAGTQQVYIGSWLLPDDQITGGTALLQIHPTGAALELVPPE